MVHGEKAPVVQKSPDAFRTISEVAETLDVPQHVLRFWETKFPQVKPMKRAGGRRYYRPDDVDLLRGIRALLYGEGYTIKGVQKVLREAGNRQVAEIGRLGSRPGARGSVIARMDGAPALVANQAAALRSGVSLAPLVQGGVSPAADVDDGELRPAKGKTGVHGVGPAAGLNVVSTDGPDDEDGDEESDEEETDGDPEDGEFEDGDTDDDDFEDDDDEDEEDEEGDEDDGDEAIDGDDEADEEDDTDARHMFQAGASSEARVTTLPVHHPGIQSAQPAAFLNAQTREALEAILDDLLDTRDLLASGRSKAAAAE